MPEEKKQKQNKHLKYFIYYVKFASASSADYITMSNLSDWMHPWGRYNLERLKFKVMSSWFRNVSLLTYSKIFLEMQLNIQIKPNK